MAEIDPTERQREDNVLLKFNINSPFNPIRTMYNLNKQMWLIDDQQKRNVMIGGVGPMRQVKQNMSYSVFHGSRTVKKPDKWDPYEKRLVPEQATSQNGLLVFATAHDQVMIENWNENNITPEPVNMSKLRPMSYDFAPFLSKPKQTKTEPADKSRKSMTVNELVEQE